MDFSLIIPVFNEERLLDELISRTLPVAESITPDFEILFVDDGSSDGGIAKLLEYRKKDDRIKVISLSKNFGHQAAYTAGLEHSKGEIVAMMDADLQDPPELLLLMYNKIKDEDFDIVSGKRTARKGASGRNLYTWAFHLFFKNVVEIKEMENVGNYSLMRRVAVDALLMMKERVRYLPGLRTFIGFRQGYVDYVRDERFRGKPKMSFRKLFQLAADAVFSFSRFPIRFCIFLGMAGTIVFMGAGIYVIAAKIGGFAVKGWPSTLLSIYFLGSIQLVFLGMLGEYVFRGYKETQNRPLYFIRKIYEGSGD
jgi:polyisoprenyl-phosphate glycosyltransferase